MRVVLGIVTLIYAIPMMSKALEGANNKSIGQLLASLGLIAIAYLLLRHALFSPLELMGINFFSGGTSINKNDHRFKHVEEHTKKGELSKALEALDKILKKYPNFKQAQIRKIQLLGNDFYDIQKALTYSKEILQNKTINRNRMDVLIIITGMLRKHGYPGEASVLAADCKNRARGKVKKLITKMEENWGRRGY